MSDSTKLEGALSLALSSDELQGLVADYAELGVDAFIQDGIARDIPIVNSLVAAVKVGVSIRDRQFAKKLLDFLAPLSKMPAEERRAVIERLENDPKYGRKVGEHLIDILDRIEAHRKPRMLARILRAYGAGEIDATMFHQLVHAIEHLPAFAVPEIRKFGESHPPNRGADATTQLYFGMAGLAVPQTTWDAQTYDPTPVAHAFLRLELDRQE